MLTRRLVEFVVVVPDSVSDADLAGATEDLFRRTVEGLGGELIEYTVTMQGPEDEDFDEPVGV